MPAAGSARPPGTWTTTAGYANNMSNAVLCCSLGRHRRSPELGRRQTSETFRATLTIITETRTRGFVNWTHNMVVTQQHDDRSPNLKKGFFVIHVIQRRIVYIFRARQGAVHRHPAVPKIPVDQPRMTRVCSGLSPHTYCGDRTYAMALL